MSTDRELALVAGLLYLAATADGRTRVRLAACSQFIMGAAYVGAAIALYPLLNEEYVAAVTC